MAENKNCLSYWFPKLEAAGVPVPRTEIVHLPRDLHEGMFAIFDGKPMWPTSHEWVRRLGETAKAFGLPCFLRTGQTSNKHNWSKTCFLKDASQIQSHVISLIEFSEGADFLGLPWDVWVLRDLLPVKPVASLPVYGGMPLVREVRAFISNGEIVCLHPYWPANAVRQGFDERPENFDEILANVGTWSVEDEREFRPLLECVGKAVNGDWSVDVLSTNRGWYVTDMALASQSFHWEGCEQAERFKAGAIRT